MLLPFCATWTLAKRAFGCKGPQRPVKNRSMTERRTLLSVAVLMLASQRARHVDSFGYFLSYLCCYEMYANLYTRISVGQTNQFIQQIQHPVFNTHTSIRERCTDHLKCDPDHKILDIHINKIIFTGGDLKAKEINNIRVLLLFGCFRKHFHAKSSGNSQPSLVKYRCFVTPRCVSYCRTRYSLMSV